VFQDGFLFSTFNTPPISIDQPLEPCLAIVQLSGLVYRKERVLFYILPKKQSNFSVYRRDKQKFYDFKARVFQSPISLSEPVSGL
jgi:hypothetical protein